MRHIYNLFLNKFLYEMARLNTKTTEVNYYETNK